MSRSDSDETLERALAEVDAAIALVERGAAARVRLAGFVWPAAAFAQSAIRARLAGVVFQLESSEVAGRVTVTVGPLESMDIGSQ